MDGGEAVCGGNVDKTGGGGVCMLGGVDRSYLLGVITGTEFLFGSAREGGGGRGCELGPVEFVVVVVG